MPTIQEHLDSPQFTDEHGESTGESSLRVGGTWARSGVPRRRGYLLYGIAFFGGLVLVLMSLVMGDGIDIFALFGLLSMALGVGGTIETVTGRPLGKLLG